jgi:hypothetical protein
VYSGARVLIGFWRVYTNAYFNVLCSVRYTSYVVCCYFWCCCTPRCCCLVAHLLRQMTANISKLIACSNNAYHKNSPPRYCFHIAIIVHSSLWCFRSLIFTFSTSPPLFCFCCCYTITIRSTTSSSSSSTVVSAYIHRCTITTTTAAIC